MYYNQDFYKFQQIQGMNMFDFLVAVKEKMCCLPLQQKSVIL
ncbi:hypothetical protein P9313_12210 [Cytobacillus firmus]|nr:hypothetical protein [Cytobacillus firmus]MED4768646.1 hypothetical protein [Cytobacillus firmus]